MKYRVKKYSEYNYEPQVWILFFWWSYGGYCCRFQAENFIKQRGGKL